MLIKGEHNGMPAIDDHVQHDQPSHDKWTLNMYIAKCVLGILHMFYIIVYILHLYNTCSSTHIIHV